MSFELSQTPTLEAVATDDEQSLAQDMQARVAEAMEQVRAASDVAAAIESSAQAAHALSKFRTAERGLHLLAKEARERLVETSQAALDALVEAAASGHKPEWKKTAAVAVLEDQIRFAGRALERLTEHSIPLAHIAGLREEAHSLEAQARGLEAIAQERARKVLGQIRAAVSDEMVLPVDMSKGVAGALLARARELRQLAVQISTEADACERKYQERI